MDRTGNRGQSDRHGSRREMSAAVRGAYRTLGLSETASPAEVRRAFRRLAHSLHPDVNPAPEAAARFKAVLAAYRRLAGGPSVSTGASHARGTHAKAPVNPVEAAPYCCPSCGDGYTQPFACPRCDVPLRRAGRGGAPLQSDPAVEAMIGRLEMGSRNPTLSPTTAMRLMVLALMSVASIQAYLGLWPAAAMSATFLTFGFLAGWHERFAAARTSMLYR